MYHSTKETKMMIRGTKTFALLSVLRPKSSKPRFMTSTAIRKVLEQNSSVEFSPNELQGTLGRCFDGGFLEARDYDADPPEGALGRQPAYEYALTEEGREAISQFLKDVNALAAA
jgi:hypothetical protein